MKPRTDLGESFESKSQASQRFETQTEKARAGKRRGAERAEPNLNLGMGVSSWPTSQTVLGLPYL